MVHLSSLFTATTSMSWDFHYIISVFKLENCTLIKSADKTNLVFHIKGINNIIVISTVYQVLSIPSQKWGGVLGNIFGLLGNLLKFPSQSLLLGSDSNNICRGD